MTQMNMNTTLNQIKDELKKALPTSSSELMKIFPEAEEIILQKLSFYTTRKKLLETRKLLQHNALKKKCKNDFELWLIDYLIELDVGAELKKVHRHISRLKSHLNVIHPSVSDLHILSDDQIIAAKSVAIESLLDQPLRKSGDRLYSSCPLHNETTPSFVVYANTNTAWCFGCQQGGDTIKLAQLLHGYSFTEAVHYLTNY